MILVNGRYREVLSDKILDSPILTDPTYTTQYSSPLKILDDSSGTIIINWTNANVQYVELTGVDRVVSFANPIAGGRYIFIIKQGSGGSKTITTWPTILWTGGSAPALTTTAARFDIVSFVYDGTNYYGSIVNNFY